LDSDQDKQKEKLSKNSRKPTKKTAETTKSTNHKKKPSASSSTNIRSAVAVHPSPAPPPKPKPKPKNRSKLGHDDNESLQSPPPLPNGSYESWEFFLDNGGYKLTTDECISVKSIVKPKRSNPVVVAEGI
jgi:hypothetical protein